MAKLNAYGRTQLVRLEKETEDGGRSTFALMSDRTILRKSSWVSSFDGKRESTGWRVYGKVKPGRGEAWAEKMEKMGFVRK